MDLIYENSGFILSTVASSEKPSQCNDNSTEEQEPEREVTSPKWIKVLLVVLGSSFVFALGGLFTLWMLINSTQMQEREREVTSPKPTKVLLIVLGFSLVFALGGLCALGMLYNNKLADESVNDQHMFSMELSAQQINNTIMKKELNDLTARYNTLRNWLSFYDAQFCNLSVDGWIACRGKLYLFSSDKLNWSSSRDVCVSKEAKLVTITNQKEQDFLVSKVKQTHWIGLNDLETEGHWVWVNNQTLKETGVQLKFWFSGGPREPDNWKKQDPSGENCAALGDERGNFQSWFDASCEKLKTFICEKIY